ncbi:MAG: hypothetical protein ABIK45_10620 [Pseudomonadota bacterium]
MEFKFVINLAIDNWITNTIAVIGSVAAVLGAIYAVRLFFISKPYCWVEREKAYGDITRIYVCIRHGLPNVITVNGIAVNGDEATDRHHLQPGDTLTVRVDVPTQKKDSVRFKVKHKRGLEYQFRAGW